MGRKGKRRGRAVDRVLLAVAVVCALGAALWLVPTAVEEHGYGELAAAEADGGRDWDALKSENPDVAAWLAVENTPIDYPVMQSKDEPERYLRRNFWGRPSLAGTPFLDARCDADGDHALVYGHHMGASDAMFSPIYRAWRQDAFDRVGDAVWETPQVPETVFSPVFAMKVDKSFADIQTFGFAGDMELHRWLLTLGEKASARADDWQKRCGKARRALTLVTCASEWSGQRERTLLVCVA